MWNPFQKKQVTSNNQTGQVQEVTLALAGLHCTSCALTIADSLEELSGVISSQTQYAQSKTKITYDESKITVPQLKKVITDLGYQVA